MDKKLTVKQEKFVHEYLVSGNATLSYQKAGYSGRKTTVRVEGCKLLTKPNIQHAIQK